MKQYATCRAPIVKKPKISFYDFGGSLGCGALIYAETEVDLCDNITMFNNGTSTCFVSAEAKIKALFK